MKILILCSFACAALLVASCVVDTAPLLCEADTAVLCKYQGPEGTEGKGQCRPGVKTCNADGQYGECEGEIHPDTEDCSTPYDEDCNGQVNDGCPCAPNTAAPCYSGPPATEDVGVCRGGIMVCNAEGTGHGPCEGEVLPGTEDCGTPWDDDCNGEINEAAAGCGCVPGTIAQCYSGPPGTEGIGPCAAGTWVCDADGKTWGPCSGEVVPLPEDCTTTADDDCDGEVNEAAAGCVCTPGALAICEYSGRPETEGVGVCAAGSHTCNALGDGFDAPCAGEVTPSIELCGTLADESCDGDVACHGYHVWGATFGESSDQYATDVAVDGEGNTFLAGDFKGQINLGGSTMTTAGAYDLFLAKFDSNGKHLWSNKYGDAQDQGAMSIAVDGSGNVLAGGRFFGTIDFDPPCFTLISQGDSDIFVAKIDPDGVCVWSRRFGGASGDGVDDVVVDGAGNVLASSFFGGTIDFGGGPLSTKAPAGEDIGIVKLSPAGNHIWSKGFGSATGGSQRAYRMAIDGANNVLVTGQITGAVDYGGGVLSSAGGTDVFVVKLNSDGNYLWSKRFGDPSNQLGTGIAVDSSGDVLVGGNFAGSMDLGGGPVTSLGLKDAFVAAFTPAGSPLWSKRFGGSSEDTTSRIAVDKANNVLLTGQISSPVDFGGGTITNVGVADAFAVKLDIEGKHQWSRSFGVFPAEQEGRAVAADELGNVLVAGGFATAIDLGAGLKSGAGSRDIFVVKLSP